MRAVTVLIALLALTICLASPRQVLPFNDGWRFLRADVSRAEDPDFADTSWQGVRLPHCWNVKDVLPGPSMYQGIGWYRRTFQSPASWRGRRVFVRFGAASLVADVFLNGTHLGQHRGGFTAFCYELTQGLRLGSKNVLAVKVDNRHAIVTPLSGDFTILGGIYRPATLIVTGPLAISPLDHASSGVYLKQTQVGPDRATVDATVKLSNGSGGPEDVSVEVRCVERRGRAVVSQASAVTCPAGAGETHIEFVVDLPHLWNGVQDPYMYRTEVRLRKGGTVLDEVDQPLGLRSFHVDPNQGFVLNGRVIHVHGVCMHQDAGPDGWAATSKDEGQDMRLLREMGVTGVRLAHYPHSETFHSLCDRNGVLVWSELAIVNHVLSTPEFLDNAREQLTELIRQNFNHPSIVVWSMYNEVNHDSPAPPGPVIRMLSDLAHREDPTRPTTGAASADTMRNLPDVMTAVDLISLNLYDGWYGGKVGGIGPEIDRFNARYGSKGVAVSEYGAGASVHQHEQGMTKAPNPGGHWHPEEWQAIFHEGSYPEIASRPFVWGSFLWVMFDFPSASRHEGDADGINDKGLVTRDRKVKKDAFFYYKANWTDAPMVYITSRRDTLRKSALTDIKVYSNCPGVTLTVDGEDLGEMRQVRPHVFLARAVRLAPGENRIEVQAQEGDRTVTDSCVWRCAG